MNEYAGTLDLPKWRRMVLLIGILSMFVLLLLRAAFIQLVPDPKVDQEIAARFERVDTLVALRGKILDRHDKLLAASQRVIEVSANPKQIKDLKNDPKKIQKMLTLLGVDQQKTMRKLGDTKKTHVMIKRNVSPQVAKEVASLGIKGLHYAASLERQYTCHEDCGQLIGKQGRETDSLKGYVGLERTFDAQLKGEDGFHKFIKAKGVVLEGIRAMARPRHGKDVVLSIDAKIQHFTYEALASAVKKNATAKAGAAVVLNAKTGEIYALATYPSFDPASNLTQPDIGYRSIAINDAFEPGSVMKSFAVAAALESGQFTPNTLIDTETGVLKIGKYKVKDHKPYGVIPVWQVLQKSSNVGSSKMAFEIGRERLWNTYRQLEFGQRTDVEFLYETPGRVNDYKHWGEIELATNSFGHGVSVSLLQLARAYTVFANEGVLLPVSLLKQESAPLGKPVFSKQTANQVRAMLQTVIGEEGTAPAARIEGYSVAGKTGTADKYNKDIGGYDKGKYISSFVGMAPASDPNIIMAVMIDEPDTTNRQHYGGVVAGPVFSEVVSRTLNHLGIPKDMPTKPTLMVQKKTPDTVKVDKVRGT